MDESFFERPILNSPYAYPARHWELDADRQPTNHIDLITPVPMPQRRRAPGQAELGLGAGDGLSTPEQQYDVPRIINEIRGYVDNWRRLPNPNQWQVTPETARLLQHWRHHQFDNLKPFFCQIEAVETAIWLAEVASDRAAAGARIWTHIRGANKEANPELIRIALKLATGAGKTTVMAMLIAWQTVNAVRHSGSQKFSRAFLVITSGITIKDRLRVLLPNDPNSYYRERELVPTDMLGDIDRAKIVITNYHAFRRRERIEVSKTGRALLQGRGPELNTLETEGQILQRACADLMGLKNIVVVSDEAHHCYREKPQADDGERLKGEDKEEAKKNNEAARLWISGIETITGDQHAGEKISAQDLLREVMNTVGKPGRLGESIRCVVSVSMLTEGWDTNTVTHILGVRAFGTQLLCEQVVGRGLRRQSYDLNEENLLPPEYADVLGIPFDFTAKPVVAPPTKPRKTVRVEAVRPDRDTLEIRFPRVEGYRIELPEERLTAKFTADSVLELTPQLVGPSITKNQGIIGEGVELTLKHLDDMRPSTILFHLARRLLLTKFKDPGDDPKLYLFGQLKRIAREWLDGGYLRCSGGTYPAQLIYQDLADRACERIKAAITESMAGEHPIKAVLDPYNPAGSTAHVRFDTSKTTLWQTDQRRCHVNWVVCDSDWEAEFCRAAEANPRVRAYVKNQGLGFEVPYLLGAAPKKYLPDFIVRVDDGHGNDDLLNLVVEIKGYRGEDAKDRANTMDAYWVPGVNNLGTFGRWAFAEFKDSVYAIAANFDALIERAVAGNAA